ncbi:MAG: AAA family ATPase [Rhodospirillales bacterium]|nr:AAA family ATPase [Rhodospirillales bacterium]
MIPLKNTIIHLIGFPGVGKLTIAKEICRQLDAVLLDNHAFNNLIFPLIRVDGKTEISDKAWEYIYRVRDTVLDAMLDLSSPDESFVLTNVFTKNDPDTRGWIRSVETTANKRNALFLPVRLLCDPEEHRTRLVQENRKEKLKMTSDHALDDWHAQDEVYDPGHPNTLTLDVTNLEPSKAAGIILTRAADLSRKANPQPETFNP